VGINGTLYDWYKSYLSNRKQRVVINGKSSDLITLNDGIPQGSILGPLLFLVFISDLSTNLENLSCLFADDTTVIRPIDNEPAICILSANNDLSNVLHWSDIWRITFNPNKTFYTRASLKLNKPILDPLLMGGVQIREVETHCNLGLIISNKMNWKAHIEHIINKVSYKMSHLKQLQYKLPRVALERIYLTMIRPIIEYGDIVYDNLTLKQTNQLERIQRRAALICTGAYKVTEHKVLLKELGSEPLKDRRKCHRLITYYKLINGPTPPHIIPHMAKPVSTHTHYNLRNNKDLRVPQCRLEISKGSFFPKTSTEWNKLPIETRASLTVNSFKNKIRPPIVINPYYRTHKGKGGVWLARIRMGLSALNAQRFSYNLIESPYCDCGQISETPIHYLWDCHSYAQMRLEMVEEIRNETNIQATRENIMDIVVHGKVEKNYYRKIYDIITSYIAKTGRFR
jgi:ribonuclease P/MRP protein subunit RPP40